MVIRKVLRKIVIPMVALLIVLFSVLTVWVLTVPPVLTEELSRQNIYRSIEYDYKVYPVVSTLYPQGTAPLLPDEGPFFANLTDRIVFNVTAEAAEIENNDLSPQEAVLNVKILVRSQDQWDYLLDFEPPVTASSPVDGTVEFNSSFVLPVQKALDISEQIFEETEVRGRDSVKLVIQSTLNTAGPNETDNLFAEYEFTLGGATITPGEELSFNDDQLFVERMITTNYLRLMGAVLDVSMGRLIFPSMLGVSLLIGGYFAIDHRKKLISGQDELQLKRKKINKHYGSKVIQVKGLKGVSDPKTIYIDVENMKELVRLSDELERPVLHMPAPNLDEEGPDRFFVVGEEAIYSYKI